MLSLTDLSSFRKVELIKIVLGAEKKVVLFGAYCIRDVYVEEEKKDF